MDEAALPPIPNLQLVQLQYELEHPDMAGEAAATAKTKMMEGIKADHMAPYYKHLCSALAWTSDAALLASMEAENAKELDKLEKAIKEAEENLGETDVREALLARAEHYCRIGDKDGALQAITATEEKTAVIGHKLDLAFYRIRIGMFYRDDKLIKTSLAKAKDLMEAGGDWDRRNRLKVYEGTFALTMRDFANAAALFLETVSTFTSYELMSYKDFAAVTVLATMIALPRVDLAEKVVKGPEIQEQLHNLPLIKTFLDSLYGCNYATFFTSLAEVETFMKSQHLLVHHYRYYVREMRIKAYTQLLESYRSVTLANMAQAFGVSVEFLDRELARFISAGRLSCKIDKVAGIVETNRPDQKNAQYQAAIKKGDMLLNQIQKLSQVINV